MPPELVFISLFVCITYSIKSVVDARARAKLVAANRPDELIRTMLVNEERQRRHAALRWGIVLSCLGIAFALIQVFGWREVTPGAIALLLAATGAGNILAYVVSRKLDPQQQASTSSVP
jgi:hypothetical protein